ncbi:Protein CBR-DAF-5 [Caenorhabditis briggsae]|uniref:Protein CBR-DAF-5 n=1 Tax=Caenorhabditis briggsae TaxID=6238 RepID=A8XYQ9_CAEBR|nr:Protein CBR-DAF-5 [Caenorhabditis briggsae]CAP37775.1 Protein CBR-DAF-5 [Caenorhabditis briggsae]
MSDSLRGSSPLPGSEEYAHSTPDSLDEDNEDMRRLLENHNEANNDTIIEETTDQLIANDGQPSTSDALAPGTSRETTQKPPVETLPEDKLWQMYMFIKPAAEDNPGRFIWIWYIGRKIPALIINGEAYMPVELLQQILNESIDKKSESLQAFMAAFNIPTRYATRTQYTVILRKCVECRKLGSTSLRLISRSNMERITGAIRMESVRTACEHDDWDDTQRVHVVHVNFIDLYDDWLENDDLEEDLTDCGVHGYWYKNRRAMRSIKCRECMKMFTPADFILHHHYPRRNETLEHVGLNSAKWTELITVHSEDRNEVNLTSWKKYCTASTRFGKRTYEEAEPVRGAKRPAIEPLIIVDDDDEMMEEELEEGEEIPENKELSSEEYEALINSGKKLTLEDYLGPKGVDGIVPKTRVQQVMKDTLKIMDQKSLEMLFLSHPDDLIVWIKEHEFAKKCELQKKHWDKVREENPDDFDQWTGAHFDPETGMFENLRLLDEAEKTTRLELREVEEKMRQLQEEMKKTKMTLWEYMLKEQKVLNEAPEDVLKLLSNIPPPPPKVLPTPTPSMPATPVLPILFPPLNFIKLAQQLQQLQAAGIKLPLPVPTLKLPPLPTPSLPLKKLPPMPPMSLPQIAMPPMPFSKVISPTESLAGTSSTPPTPVEKPSKLAIPTLPLSPQAEFLRQQLTLALQNPTFFPFLAPKLPPQFENLLSSFLPPTKPTAVKN